MPRIITYSQPNILRTAEATVQRACTTGFKFGIWYGRPLHTANCPWSAFESLQWIRFHLTCLTGLRPSVPVVWCQDRYQSPAASCEALCWAQCSSFHTQKTSRWFSTVIKSIVIYVLMISRLMWAYLPRMCHWRVRHLKVISLTSLRGVHHVDCSSMPLKHN